MGIESRTDQLDKETLSFGEKCGVVGVYDHGHDAPFIARHALMALQHRGQEGAGLSVCTPDNAIYTHHGFGLIPNAITNPVLENLPDSNLAIAHNRYSTVDQGRENAQNLQPIHLQDGAFAISLGHNGNLFATDLISRAVSPKTDNLSDSHLLAAYLLHQRQNYRSWSETLTSALPQISDLGAFSLTILTDEGHLFGVRDPRGIRPLVLGQLPNGWIMASETVALDAVKANFLREVKPGEIIEIQPDGDIKSSPFGKPVAPKPCIFEGVYFSRPDSFTNGYRVSVGREKSGQLLGERLQAKGIDPDAVVPVLDSGMWAALGTARNMNLPYEPAITTSHYVGRTFIQPDQTGRQNSVNGKHNFTPEGVTDKKVVFVDDSGIRFTTSPAIVQGLKDSGATQTHAGFASPPVTEPCDLGIDTNHRSKRDELPASRWVGQPQAEVENRVADLIGADSATYLPIEQLAEAMGEKKRENYCYHCFGGPHPIKDSQPGFRQKERPIIGKPKISVLISGGGTNLQQIINGVKSGDIDADITQVISNNPQAYGITRAEENNIPVTVLPSRGKLKDPDTRAAYERELMREIHNHPPDIIVLAGWMVVLSNDFITQSQQLEIPIINLHPALLTPGNSAEITTSHGKIPVIRGTHAIQDAYDQRLPVSGVTVHQLLPNNAFDVGPVILQEEVRRVNGETLAQWESKIHAAEYRTLPSALKRVLHVMKHNIDVSKGDYPW